MGWFIIDIAVGFLNLYCYFQNTKRWYNLAAGIFILAIAVGMSVRGF